MNKRTRSHASIGDANSVFGLFHCFKQFVATRIVGTRFCHLSRLCESASCDAQKNGSKSQMRKDSRRLMNFLPL